ncbi:MAG: Wzz/FepE/Etk N-terminal domain-containing protein [Anaerolineae bacterium]|nr:Wzz/FepE/Etk N-terminal domain-containing protein [Anaerolineae bacterium]
MSQTVEPSQPSLAAALLRRWWLIALLAVAAAVAALVFGSRIPPSYRTSTRLQVNVLDTQEVTLFTRLATTSVNDQVGILVSDFVDIVRSPTVAWRTIGDLGLPGDARELLSRLDVSIQGVYVTVAYADATPEQAQQVLTRHVENAIAHYQALQVRPSREAGQFLRSELDRQQRQVAAAQAALAQFQLQHGLADLTREMAALQDELRALRSTRAGLLAEAARAEAAAEYWRRRTAEAEAAAEQLRTSLSAPAEGADVDGVAEQVKEQTAQAAAYRANAEAQEALAAGQRAAADAQDQVIAQRSAELAQLIGLSSQYEALLADLAAAQADYDFLRNKLTEAELKERQVAEVGYFEVVEPAGLPTSASGLQGLPLALLAGLAGLLFGVALVLLGEALRAPADS